MSESLEMERSAQLDLLLVDTPYFFLSQGGRAMQWASIALAFSLVDDDAFAFPAETATRIPLRIHGNGATNRERADGEMRHM